MYLSTWSAISVLRRVREPLMFWRHVLGADFEKVRPLLVACEGVAGTHVPCPDTGIRLELRGRADGSYLAYPTGDHCDDVDDRELTWTEAQAWQVDGGLLQAALCEALGLVGVAGCTCEVPDVHLVGFCERSGVRRSVYLCHATDAESGARLAADGGRTADAGCILFPERQLAVDHVLNGRGVAGVVLVDCVKWVDGKMVGECGQVCKGVGPDITHAELRTHFDRRFDTVGRDFADLERENKQLKQDLAQLLANIARQVDPEFFQWIFVILGTGSVNAAARVLKMPGSTFAERVSDYVARGGVYKTLFSMLKVRRKGVGRVRIERFNELFGEHQGVSEVAQPDVLRELLDGLEALNGGNWASVRGELIALVKGELPEDSP